MCKEYFIGKKATKQINNGTLTLHVFKEVLTFPDGDKFPAECIKTMQSKIPVGSWCIFEAVPDKIKTDRQKNQLYINGKNHDIHTLPDELNTFLSSKNWEDFSINTYIAEIQHLLDNLNTSANTERTAFEELEQEVSNTKSNYSNLIEHLSSIVEEFNEPINGHIKQLQTAIESAESLKPIIEKSNTLLNKLKASGLNIPQKLLQLLNPSAEDDSNPNITDHNQADISGIRLNFKSDVFNAKGLVYSEFQIRNFIALLMTHDLIVLSGMSGSGKTQMVKAIATALGGESRIIPVKPNWTSSEDLVGYFNPMQMAFMPTPFTDAIVEASENPGKIFFICLDEMNIARPEYYFADFLSQLEERTNPQIDLYAESEKDAFLHELNALLGLTQSDDQKGGASDTANPTNIDAAWKKLPAIDKARIQKRLNNIFRYPPKLAIPENVRFIGTINVDDTTHYLSPKILDRVHVVKFENPLLVTEKTNQTTSIQFTENFDFPQRSDYPKIEAPSTQVENKKNSPRSLFGMLNELNKNLEKLKIDFGPRTIRQSLNYHECLSKAGVNNDSTQCDITYNSIINQKVLPRLVMDGNIKVDGKTRVEFLTNLFAEEGQQWAENKHGKHHSLYIKSICNNAKANHNQINFFA